MRLKGHLAAVFRFLKEFEMAETQRDKRIRALAVYASLERALYSLDELLDNQCAHYGLSRSQYRVLEHVFLYGAMATGTLAGRILFSDGTISVVTRNLAKVGLLVRRGDEADGRKAIVHLTEVGKSLVGEILPKRAKLLRAKMCVLGKREQENLDRLCQKLAAGDAVKFMMEVTLEDENEERRQIAVGSRSQTED
jgi:MarR family transcriptional regulator, 2-MHQ and catechol-resistance regulon repressor